MSNPFDTKNQRDFDENTEKLVAAIDKINNAPSLSATIAELSKLTGLHRNAISNRVWPNQKLQLIKEKRKSQQQAETKPTVNKNPIKILEDKLDNAKNELVYWFNKNLDNEKQIKQLEINLERMSLARNDYETMLKQERDKTTELTKQLNIMRDLLS
ncbi:hypothetical protein H5187_23405 [Pseudoalteromonas sp. SG44-1]|uniref:hypothetical protein n=1 Tax=unclassified Pseudoalteromonas TaxID=194690 RepID=UPI0015FF5E1E|nr:MULTISPECIES: hypothetical protein [unclassified Pseudoalteromonas]MBB1420162.1 hypothetical protein [Pseudoalteromonas sp. SG44-1]MBB1480250.1 hypothetical protein [Pseudoalteromonas sp. SG41-2]